MAKQVVKASGAVVNSSACLHIRAIDDDDDDDDDYDDDDDDDDDDNDDDDDDDDDVDDDGDDDYDDGDDDNDGSGGGGGGICGNHRLALLITLWRSDICKPNMKFWQSMGEP